MTAMGSGTGQQPTRLGFSSRERGYVIGGFGLGGLVLGLVIRPVAGWASELRWVPFKGPLELIASADQPWAAWVVPLLGLAAGVVFGLYVIHESPILHIDDEQIQVEQKGQQRTIRRVQVATVYRDGSNIVLETEQGRTLFTGDVEGGKDTVRRAFVNHGYPWDAEPD